MLFVWNSSEGAWVHKFKSSPKNRPLREGNKKKAILFDMKAHMAFATKHEKNPVKKQEKV